MKSPPDFGTVRRRGGEEQARPRVWPSEPPPAKVKQSRKLVAVRRSDGRTVGVHDDDGDVVLAEAGEADKRVRRRAGGPRTDGGTGLAAVQKCHFAYYEQGGKHFFILRTHPQPRRGDG